MALDQEQRDKLARWMGWTLHATSGYSNAKYWFRKTGIVVSQEAWLNPPMWGQVGMLMEGAAKLEYRIEIHYEYGRWHCWIYKGARSIGRYDDTGPEAVATAVLAMIESAE